MIPRYTRPEMGKIFADQNRFEAWLAVELAAAEALARPAGLPRGPLILPAGKRVSLSFLSGAREGSEHVLRHASLLIGRQGGNSGAAIELSENQVSRMHAVLEVRGTRFVLRDLQSKNGTYVGKERVQEVEIHPGTEFQIGDTRFVLRVADEKA